MLCLDVQDSTIHRIIHARVLKRQRPNYKAGPIKIGSIDCNLMYFRAFLQSNLNKYTPYSDIRNNFPNITRSCQMIVSVRSIVFTVSHITETTCELITVSVNQLAVLLQLLVVTW